MDGMELCCVCDSVIVLNNITVLQRVRVVMEFFEEVWTDGCEN